jgi:hypothetical protein
VAGADEGDHGGCRGGDSGVGLIRLAKHGRLFWCW